MNLYNDLKFFNILEVIVEKLHHSAIHVSASEAFIYFCCYQLHVYTLGEKLSLPHDCYFAYLYSFTETLMKLSQKNSSNLALLMQLKDYRYALI